MKSIIVESRYPLNSDQKQKLAQKLITPDQTGDHQIEYRIDPSIIGGLRLVTPEQTIDLSIAARIQQLGERLQTKD